MKQKLLLVDDKKENLMALEGILEDLNVECIYALSGEEALTKTLKHEFALILIDIQMPGMDGYETVELLRKRKNSAGIPVIFISAIYSNDYYKIKGFEAGAVDFIAKPVVPDILAGKIRAFLELDAYKARLISKNQELAQANAALAASRMSFQSLVDKNQMGMMVVNKQGIVQFVNPAMQTLLNLHGDLLGKPLGIPIGGKKRTEITITRSQNEMGIAEMDVAETLWESEPAYLVMLYDITERKQKERALQDALQVKGKKN